MKFDKYSPGCLYLFYSTIELFLIALLVVVVSLVQLRLENARLETERGAAASRCDLLTDQLATVHAELAHKNNLVARLTRLVARHVRTHTAQHSPTQTDSPGGNTGPPRSLIVLEVLMAVVRSLLLTTLHAELAHKNARKH